MASILYEMTENITIVRTTFTKDEAGGQSVTFSVIGAFYAKIEDISTSVSQAHQRATQTNRYRAIVRYDGSVDLSTKNQIVWETKYYAIASVKKLTRWDGRFMEIIFEATDMA